MIEKGLKALSALSFLWLALARLVIGFVFIQSGWGKLHHLDKVIGFFESLHIPFASIQAPFVASCELFFGALILLGLLTRLASLPLIAIMAVAILTAKLPDINAFSDLLNTSEFLYIVILLFLLSYGAGLLSVDHVLRKKHVLFR